MRIPTVIFLADFFKISGNLVLDPLLLAWIKEPMRKLVQKVQGMPIIQKAKAKLWKAPSERG